MIFIGKLVNTHGIKGEVRIKSDIDYKEIIFKKGNNLYIDKQPLKINSYRIHKGFDMVTFEGINDINDVLKYKGKNVFINKEELNEDIIFNEELIGYEVYNDKYLGKVVKLMKNKLYDILVIKKNEIENLIPNIEEFVIKIDSKEKKIYIKEIEGLINED